jgi:hypothetical protein
MSPDAANAVALDRPCRACKLTPRLPRPRLRLAGIRVVLGFIERAPYGRGPSFAPTHWLAPRNVGCARGSRRVFSDSIVKQPALARIVRRSHGGERRRPLRSGAGLAPSFPSPSPMRERSAERRGYPGHLCEGARLPIDRQARLPALHWRRFSSRAALPGSGRTSFHFAPIQAGTCAAFHPVHVQPSKAAPVLRRVRAVVRDDPGAACVSTATQAPHPAPPNKRL